MTLSDRYSKALQFAFELHKYQERKKTGIPYISHLISVSALVMEYGGSEDQAIAALLHDAVEDQGGRPTLNKIRKKFGPRVAGIVDGCTDSYVVPKPPWQKRKEQYLAGLVKKPALVQLVSSADKLHNVRTIIADYRKSGEKVWERFTGGREGSLWYYRALADAFVSSGRTPIASELNLAVSQLEMLSRKIPPRGMGGT